MTNKRRRRVYIVNQSGHDFSAVKAYGEPYFLTKGLVNRQALNYMYRQSVSALKDSNKNDYILISGLASQVAILSTAFGFMHGKVNFLIYEAGQYHVRRIKLNNLIDK